MPQRTNKAQTDRWRQTDEAEPLKHALPDADTVKVAIDSVLDQAAPLDAAPPSVAASPA